MLVLFQSSKVLERPWCLLELYTAVMEGVPIVALNCAGKGYDFGKSADLLLHLETKLSKLNPSAIQVLKQHGVDPVHAAHILSSTIPNIISVHLNTSASRIAIKAAIVDLVLAMRSAKPFPVKTSVEDWLESRGELDAEAKRASLGHGTISGTVKGQMMAKASRADELAKEVAELKREFKLRERSMDSERAEFKSRMDSERAEFKSRERSMDSEQAEFMSRMDSERAEFKAALQEQRGELKAERAKRDSEREKNEAKLEKLEAKNETLEAKIEKLEAKLEQQ